MSKFFNQLKKYKGFHARYVVFGMKPDSLDFMEEVSGRCHTHWITAMRELDKLAKEKYYIKLAIIKVTDK
ncbi:MAG: hypothetical protein J6S85_09280 [Methanobrevibacter sp.]|nr:hypothetical protein [Methanobrevibacter sp.]